MIEARHNSVRRGGKPPQLHHRRLRDRGRGNLLRETRMTNRSAFGTAPDAIRRSVFFARRSRACPSISGSRFGERPLAVRSNANFQAQV